MPQFEFANFIPQMAWLALVFAILYFAVVTPTLPKLGRVVQAREDKIGGDIAAADAAKSHADGVAADYAAQIAASQNAARAAIAKAKDDSAQSVAAKLGVTDAELKARAEAAQAQLETARTSALAEIEAVVAESAADIVHKLTGVRPASDAASLAASSAFQRS